MKNKKKKLTLISIAVVIVISLLFVLLSEKPGENTAGQNRIIPDLLDDAERSRNLIADIFTQALSHALDSQKKDIVIARLITISNFQELKTLNIHNSPDAHNKIVFNYEFKLLSDAIMAADTHLKTLRMVPVIAWPVISEGYPKLKFPVLLGDPRDGYRMGAKSIRIKWLLYKDIMALVAQSNPPDLTRWQWYDPQLVFPKIKMLQAQL